MNTITQKIKSICGPQQEVYLTLEQLQIIEKALEPIAKTNDDSWRAYKKISMLVQVTEDYQKERYA